MSYTPTPAGHEDAPLEQIVTVEKDLQVEALYEHVVPMKNRMFQDFNEVNAHLWEFFTTHAPLDQERVRMVLNDLRFSFNGVSYSIWNREYEPFPVLPWLQPVLLRTCSDNVLEDDGAYDALCGLGDQGTRVLVDRVLHAQDTVIGARTKNTLFIITQDRMEDCSHFFAAEQSVFVHLGRRSFSNDGNVSLGTGSLYIGCDPLLVQSISRQCDIGDEPTIPRWYDGGIGRQPELHEYLRELLERCRDPHTVHGRYGATPGPRILGDIKELLWSYKPLSRPGAARQEDVI